jgi:type II secretory pathway component PulC
VGLGRKLLDYAVPLGIGATALLNARTVSSLVGVTLEPPPTAARVEATGDRGVPASPSLAPRATRDARAILERNPFEHGARGAEAPAKETSTCAGVRPLVVVGADDPQIAFAALDVGGKRVLKRRGDHVDGMRIAHVGRESVWLEQDGRLCEARLFRRGDDAAASGASSAAGAAGASSAAIAKAASASESPLAGKVERVSPTELHVDRGALDRLLEARAELARVRAVPEGRGLRLVGIKPGSSLALLGLEPGDRLDSVGGVELSDTEHLLATYARLRTGNLDRLTVRVDRRGRPLDLDYVIR